MKVKLKLFDFHFQILVREKPVHVRALDLAVLQTEADKVLSIGGGGVSHRAHILHNFYSYGSIPFHVSLLVK